MKGVILLNLGSPDSTQVSDVRRYLGEFLMDERVLDAPKMVRCFLLTASTPRRPKESAEAYASIWTEKGSPLILTSYAQQAALQDHKYSCKLRDVIIRARSLHCKNLSTRVDDLFIVPMYPHYAMSSYETAVVHLMKSIRELAPAMKTTLCLLSIKMKVTSKLWSNPLNQCSNQKMATNYFHGIPSHLVKGDPSHEHCMTTPDCCTLPSSPCYMLLPSMRHDCGKFVTLMDLPKEKYTIAFQSRLEENHGYNPTQIRR